MASDRPSTKTPATDGGAGAEGKQDASNAASNSASNSNAAAAGAKQEEQPKAEFNIKRDDLWVNALERVIKSTDDDGKEVESLIQMTGVGEERGSHTVYAHVAKGPSLSVSQVLEVIVDEGYKAAARHSLEKHVKIQADRYPNASKLLELGSVWLCNETAWCDKTEHDAHLRRLSSNPADAQLKPNWNDFTLKVCYAPPRYYAAYTVDWTKYCRGLLVANASHGNVKTVQALIGNETPHVPVLEGMPDVKDGVIVYEDGELGFAVLNKPCQMPIHSSKMNHLESVVAMYHNALEERKNVKHSHYVTKTHVAVLPQFATLVDTETSGLVAVATRSEFSTYLTSQLMCHPHHRTNHHHHHSNSHDNHAHGGKNNKRKDNQNRGRSSSPVPSSAHFSKKFKCLVCIKDPHQMDMLEELCSTNKTVTHYIDPKAVEKTRRHDPKHFAVKKVDKHWQQCQMRIVKVGDERFRAACVRSKDSVDASLAKRLWSNETPAIGLGIQYVMELEIELLTSRQHQIRGQLAAMGTPIVGDQVYGGGKCDFHSEGHTWYRMALQCCELSFREPEWHEKQGGSEDGSCPSSGGSKGKRELVQGKRECVFKLKEAWWTEYLDYYEMLVLRTAKTNPNSIDIATTSNWVTTTAAAAAVTNKSSTAATTKGGVVDVDSEPAAAPAATAVAAAATS